jgi:DNA-binding PucR family transcriptional regulator
VHQCIAVWTDDETVHSSDLRDAATEVIAELGGTGAVFLDVNRTTVAAWTALAPRADRRSGGFTAPGVVLALGMPEAGVEGFRQSYRDALQARRIAILRDLPIGSVVRYEDVALQVLATGDLDQARRFVAWQLGPLAGESAGDRQLAATLRAFLKNESNLRATAAAMGIHHNTVANRLRRIDELLGAPVAGRSAELLLALELLEVTRRLAPLAPAASETPYVVPSA